ncbi:flagellar type III secretion system protein FlhB [Candidatus Fukatsuia endosymbiont of Tuberolachnus salignus]|uniref:flagellar type III secretion system protein FlhB n=1 Tax=Candidatus Fukatsuia endosymbiont of Tuberolachnus salignus TaxID=3077957 RepID=UPI00313C6B83
MSGGGGEKSEKPTGGKLSKARRKGDIPRSKDMTMGAGLLASFFTLALFFPYYRQLCEESFISIGMMAGKLDDNGAMEQFMLRNFLVIFKFIATLLPIPLVSIIASLIPGGWIFTTSKLIQDLKKLSPISGFKRLFSLSHITDVLKMLLKCTVLIFTLCIMVKNNLAELMYLQSIHLQEAISLGFSHYHYIFAYFIAIIIIFSLFDVPLSKYMFIKKMKMTKQEVKEEHKNNDGNPHTKARIRQLQHQFSIGQINKTVPVADVIITNPTHYSVALKYDPQKASAPYIVAKGKDDIALYIRKVAQENGIEVVEFPPLARVIYHSTRVNQQIPAPLYRAIAQVLTYVMQIKSWRSGQAEKPALDTHLGIPKEMLKAHDK